MNPGRDFYLKVYGGGDNLDHMLKMWGLTYPTWRWWHAPMQHGKAIGYSMAYEMYKDCALGKVNLEWKVDKPMTGPEFRDRLAEQQCQYRSANAFYPGDKEFLSYKRLDKKRREKMPNGKSGN